MENEFDNLTTEARNSNSENFDQKSSLEILQIMNNEDKKIAKIVETQLPIISKAVDKIVDRLRNDGRLIYLGAGTSGRLGLLDAVECPPTFGVSKDTVIGIMAGGETAFEEAKEGIEDDKKASRDDLREIEFDQKDCLVGITSSGRTPYVLGGIEYAKGKGALTIGLSCNSNTKVSKLVDIPIECVVGPEVITGSTRLKAGTAQKMILNMISTAVMVRLGKVYDNLMVDIKPTNQKLTKRAVKIIKKITNISSKEAKLLLKKAKYKPKVAIVMYENNCNYKKAVKKLQKNSGFVRKAIN